MSLTIALAGNPNSGKTTMFNKLTGANQRVGNWPGVTIDRKVGKIRGTDYELVDLPGIYSLSPYSPEEIVSRNFLIEDRPDAVINIVDATNLERNLFLTLQIIDTGIPTVVALNMMDQIRKLGDTIDIDKLSKDLGCRVVPVSALNAEGIKELVKAVGEVAEAKQRPEPMYFDGDVEAVISQAREAMQGKVPDDLLRFYSVKLVERDNAVIEKFPEADGRIAGAVRELEDKKDDEADSIIADGRYTRITEIAKASVKKAPRDERGTFSDRVDRIVTHRIWGIPIFIGVIAVVFFGIIGFSWGDFEIVGIGTYCTDWVNDVFIGEWIDPAVRDWCASDGNFSALDALLCSGIIGGVGAVIGFLPQMLLMFLALCILEDIGYMARIAFVMDRVFRHFGLSGKTLIPLLVGTGCGVPGVMASRTIESERDRRITAMTTTFIPCGAKLPAIAMITSAVFPGNGLIAVFCYVMGIIMVLISGIILKKLKSLSGTPAPFIMELPPYHIPSATNIIKGTLDRGWAFCKKAGTIILLSCIILWFLASYDTGLNYIGDNTGDAQSILAAFGEAVCIIFAPLGWGDNWELTVGTITGLIAKENVVGTFGTLFGIEAGDNGEGLEVVLAGMLTKSSGLAFLAFNLICAPCFAAIGAMHRELGKWKDTGMAVLYQCLLAYAVALVIYGFTSYIGGWNTLTIDGAVVEQAAPIGSTIAAVIVLAIIVYLLWAKDPFRQLSGKDEYDAEEEMKA